MINAEQAADVVQAAAEVVAGLDGTFPPVAEVLERLREQEYQAEVDPKALAHLVETLMAAGVPGWWNTPRSVR
jgi:hypothetical protein